MSALHELKTKIASIPEKQSRRNIVGNLTQYTQKAVTARDTLAQSIKDQSYVQMVFPDADLQRVSAQVRKAASVARILHRNLSESIETIQSKSSNDGFISLGEFAKTAQTALRDRWSQLLKRSISDFENLIRAVSGTDIEGTANLVETLNRLRNLESSPPGSSAAAVRVASDLRRLAESVNTLGLKGRAGEFLIAAKDGRGNPRDLCDSEIVEFIDRYGLWGLLTVKLGPRT